MNPSHLPAARSIALAGLAAVAALTLAACGGSSGGSGGSGSSGQQASGGSQATSGSSPSAAASSGSGSGAVTTAAYFPVGAGYTWVYNATGFGGKGAVTDKVLSVTPSPAGEKAVMSNTITYPLKKTTRETLIFRPDGSIQVPMTQFGASVTIESGTMVWPSAAQLASGQPYHNTIVMKLNEAGHSQRMTLPLTVKGGGSTSVTVPAGTYQATLINETLSSSVMGVKFSLAVRTWVANGVGPVKSEVFSSALGGSSATPLTSEELVSFTK